MDQLENLITDWHDILVSIEKFVASLTAFHTSHYFDIYLPTPIGDTDGRINLYAETGKTISSIKKNIANISARLKYSSRELAKNTFSIRAKVTLNTVQQELNSLSYDFLDLDGFLKAIEKYFGILVIELRKSLFPISKRVREWNVLLVSYFERSEHDSKANSEAISEAISEANSEAISEANSEADSETDSEADSEATSLHFVYERIRNHCFHLQRKLFSRVFDCEMLGLSCWVLSEVFTKAPVAAVLKSIAAVVFTALGCTDLRRTDFYKAFENFILVLWIFIPHGLLVVVFVCFACLLVCGCMCSTEQGYVRIDPETHIV